MRYQEPEVLGRIAVDVMRNDMHRPITSGKCHRNNVEDGIVGGIVGGFLPAMNKEDVEFICDMIDDLIEKYNRPSEAA